MARKKQSSLHNEYIKQRKRIQSFIRRAEKRGYTFTKQVLPSIPKKITQASVRRLSKLTPKELYKSTEYIDYTTGEVLTHQQRQKQVRLQAVEKRKQTIAQKKKQKPSSINWYKQAVDNFKFQLKQVDGIGSHKIASWLFDMLEKYSVEEVGQAILKASQQGIVLTFYILYNSSGAIEFISELLNYFEEMGQLEKDSISDMMDEYGNDTEWNDL